MAWLTLLAALLVLRAAAGQAMFPHLAAVIEPLRDHLVRTVVGGTLARATDLATPTDAAAVSRLTRQVDTVRALCAALLRTARPLGVTLVAATVGLLALNPVAAAVTLPPLALALVLYPVSLGPIARCRRLLVLADEQVAAEVGAP